MALPAHASFRVALLALVATAAHGVAAAQASGPAPAPMAQPAARSGTADELPRVRVGGLWYIGFQAGQESDKGYSRFVIKRGYLNVEADILPFLSARFTPDVFYDDDGFEVRIKYAVARFRVPEFGFVARPEVTFGIIHTPWLDFEEHVDRFRVQDTMFIERSGLINSADLGVSVSGLFGGVLPEKVQQAIGSHFPGRYGSFAIGVYNGGGYTAAENNQNKTIEARVTGRPLPDAVPGLQVSYSLIRGKGNTTAAPEWTSDLVFVSWEHRRAVLTGQWESGAGNQRGDMIDAATGEALPHRGWSVFGEGRITPAWSVIGRVDRFDRDTRTAGDRTRRAIGGLARHLGRRNMVLVDIERVSHEQPEWSTDYRFQASLQVVFE